MRALGIKHKDKTTAKCLIFVLLIRILIIQRLLRILLLGLLLLLLRIPPTLLLLRLKLLKRLGSQ